MTLYDIMHAIGVGALVLIAGTVALVMAGEVWAYLTKRDPAEFWESKRYETEETYRHATQYNRSTESALPQVIGGDFEYNAHALDWSHDDTRPAA